MRLRLPLFFAVALAVAAAGGCKPELIAGTSIEDSEENRKVLEFLGRYQQAMENRSPDDVAKLCAADYYETNGNTDPKDDYNLDGLKQKLGDHFGRTKELTLEVYVQIVDRSEPGVVAVAYRYNTRALVTFPAGDKWVTATEVTKVKLRAVDGDELGYRIIAGL